jgi:hypothetical protein
VLSQNDWTAFTDTFPTVWGIPVYQEISNSILDRVETYAQLCALMGIKIHVDGVRFDTEPSYRKEIKKKLNRDQYGALKQLKREWLNNRLAALTPKSTNELNEMYEQLNTVYGGEELIRKLNAKFSKMKTRFNALKCILVNNLQKYNVGNGMVLAVIGKKILFVLRGILFMAGAVSALFTLPVIAAAYLLHSLALLSSLLYVGWPLAVITRFMTYLSLAGLNFFLMLYLDFSKPGKYSSHMKRHFENGVDGLRRFDRGLDLWDIEKEDE